MTDFGYSKAQEQYDSQLPKRYEEKPLFICSFCKEDIFEGEQIVAFEDKIYCCHCAVVRYAEREDYEE